MSAALLLLGACALLAIIGPIEEWLHNRRHGHGPIVTGPAMWNDDAKQDARARTERVGAEN